MILMPRNKGESQGFLVSGAIQLKNVGKPIASLVQHVTVNGKQSLQTAGTDP